MIRYHSRDQLAAYYIWGAHQFADEDPSFKSWSASSKASDTLLRVRRAYFVYVMRSYHTHLV